VPLVLKFLPLLLGVGAGVLLGGGGESTPADLSIPDPPNLN